MKRHHLSSHLLFLLVTCTWMPACKTRNFGDASRVGQASLDKNADSAKSNVTNGQKTSLQKYSIGTYNIENLWDGDVTNTPSNYPDLSQEYSNWFSDRIFEKRAKNAARAIEMAGSPDVFALQEIELGGKADGNIAMELLKGEIAKLGYTQFLVGPQSGEKAVMTTAVVAKGSVTLEELPSLKFLGTGNRGSRDPQVVKVTFGTTGKSARLYNSHWISKKGDKTGTSDGPRQAIAKLIRDDIDAARAIEPALDVIVMGDFNSNYNENVINDKVPSGLVEFLGSTGDLKAMLTAPSRKLYNLWFDIPLAERGSLTFAERWESFDHILVSDSLFDKNAVQVVPHSFRVIGRFKGTSRDLINADGNPLSWQVKEFPNQFVEGKGKGKSRFVHMGEGFSDHLPVVADFTVVDTSDISHKIHVGEPSATDLAPPDAPLVHAENCALKETTHDALLVDFTLPNHFKSCFAIRSASLPIEMQGRVPTVKIAGKSLALMVFAAQGVNKDYRLKVLGHAQGRTLKSVRGRLGWWDGWPAIFAAKPQDIVIE